VKNCGISRKTQEIGRPNPPYNFAVMSLPVIDLLQKLLAIPSVNPVFGAPQSDWVGEGRLTDFLQDWAIRQGWKWLRQEVYPGRENLIAVVGNSLAGGKPITLWEVHQDTVGVAGMQIDPFAGIEKEGRIYGRGACDVKGSMAAMLTALSEASDRQGTILIAFTVNEECGFSGAKALGRLWDKNETEVTRGTLTIDELRSLKPHRAIVAEPTDLKVVVTHKGIVRWRCHTRGRAAHSSQPQHGKNAIYAMTDVISSIRQFDREVLTNRGKDCLCGRPTVSVNTIQGGTGANVVPDHAVIDIDYRMMPGEVPNEAQAELIDYIASKISAEAQFEHEPPWNQSRGMQEGSNRIWAEQVAQLAGSEGQAAETVGVPYGTDAWVFASHGIPTVVIGPGSITQAHTEDEWISIAELERGVEIYRRLAAIV
jgi:acetylornithine deacetylase/succinyl-diaminopimelate desuccinylase-like protein